MRWRGASKDANPDAEYICWLYLPSWKPLAPWVYELGSHIPKDVTLQINFESGAVKYQLDRPRVGGDYWLSFIGPSERFARICRKGVGPRDADVGQASGRMLA